MPSAKNLPLSAAAADLGMGNQLYQELLDSEEERRKKLLRQAQSVQMQQQPLGPATQTLFGSAGGFHV
jgi:hypothetical protein